MFQLSGGEDTLQYPEVRIKYYIQQKIESCNVVEIGSG